MSYQKWDPFVPDLSPHALNKEFSSSDLSAFTTVNMGTDGAAADADTTVRGSLFYDIPSQNWRWRCHLLALPGDTNYTIHSAIYLASIGNSSANATGGIVLSDTNTTNTGKQTAVALSFDGSLLTARMKYGWDVFGETTSGAVSTNRGLGGHFSFLRLRKESGTYYAAWSGDGETWWEDTLSITGGVTPAYFGLFTQSYTTGQLRASFPYLRYYANGTQYTTGALVWAYAPRDFTA